ncbi:MAG: hypothetical protein HC902_01190 [Calothrix sp. SM1_5_4]|nr:hypothetical protein [Calothrix sp. SM1_5_4]
MGGQYGSNNPYANPFFQNQYQYGGQPPYGMQNPNGMMYGNSPYGYSLGGQPGGAAMMPFQGQQYAYPFGQPYGTQIGNMYSYPYGGGMPGQLANVYPAPGYGGGVAGAGAPSVGGYYGSPVGNYYMQIEQLKQRMQLIQASPVYGGAGAPPVLPFPGPSVSSPVYNVPGSPLNPVPAGATRATGTPNIIRSP